MVEWKVDEMVDLMVETMVFYLAALMVDVKVVLTAVSLVEMSD